MSPSRWQTGAAVAGLLLSGTIVTLSVKTLYQTEVEGLDGFAHFTKPWFLTFAMFLGMLCALPLHLVTATAKPELPWPEVAWKCALPAACDLLATTVSAVGLIFVSASTFQICRGASVLFMALFTVLFLHRVLSHSQLLGVALASLALAAVGRASVAAAGAAAAAASEDAEDAAAKALVGVLLVAGAQVFQGIQFVWEEKQLKQAKLPPLLLCGVEGAFGSVAMALIVFPVLAVLPGEDAAGCLESTRDTLVKVSRSTTLQLLVLMYIIAVLIMNLCGIYCTKVLSGMHRSLLQSGMRTLCVWVSGLTLWQLSGGRYGEPWVGEASLLEVAGFLAFVCGFLLYIGAVRLPERGGTEHTGYFALPGSPPQVAVHFSPDVLQSAPSPELHIRA